MKRFTALLIFRYGVKGRLRRRVLCERRLIRLDARSPKAALAAARRYGARESISYPNPNGDIYTIEFVGVADLAELTYAADQEVWHVMYETLKPRGGLKAVRRFRVFRTGGVVGDAWEAVPRQSADPSLLKPMRSRSRRKPRAKGSLRGRHAGA